MIDTENNEAHNASTAERPQSRFAAVSFIDVVGYSRLMERDQPGTHRRWMSMRGNVIEPRVELGGGKVIKSTGDGLLLEFENEFSAVNFALGVQHYLGKLASEESEPLQLRISVNVGDIIAEKDDIYGDGVNIAARLQEFAGSGGVVISGTVHDRARKLLNYHAADLGFLTLKNIEQRVRAFKIAHLEMAVPRAITTQGHQPSIAVLPLQTLGLDEGLRYLAQGIIHDIVASLAGIRELFVISSTSTLAFADTTIDPVSVCRLTPAGSGQKLDEHHSARADGGQQQRHLEPFAGIQEGHGVAPQRKADPELGKQYTQCKA